MAITILGIESSCDDTSAAVLRDEYLLANVMASQDVHRQYGGVIPELASRAHQQNIVPVVSEALRRAGVSMDEVDAIAFTRGPGLLGSLLVGTSFAKGLSVAAQKPIIEVNHLQGHILSHFVKVEGRDNRCPAFPFLCLLVSGGNSQIVLVRSYSDMEIVGQTIDDAAGEAFDKCAKSIGGPYPGGPYVDKMAQQGDADMFHFAKPHIEGYNYSFSGLKTSFLYLIRDNLKKEPDFIEKHRADLCASIQKTVIEVLMEKLRKVAHDLKINRVAVSGGVSANSELRKAFQEHAARYGWEIFLPKLSFTTDNAAMIAIAGMYKYLNGELDDLSSTPFSKVVI